MLDKADTVIAVVLIMVLVTSPIWALLLEHYSRREREWRQWQREHPEE